MNDGEKGSIDQYGDLNLFLKEYEGEELMISFISYPDMKTKHPIEIIDLRHQLDHITLKKVKLFHVYGADPGNARFFLISIRRKERI